MKEICTNKIVTKSVKKRKKQPQRSFKYFYAILLYVVLKLFSVDYFSL